MCNLRTWLMPPVMYCVASWTRHFMWRVLFDCSLLSSQLQLCCLVFSVKLTEPETKAYIWHNIFFFFVLYSFFTQKKYWLKTWDKNTSFGLGELSEKLPVRTVSYFPFTAISSIQYLTPSGQIALLLKQCTKVFIGVQLCILAMQYMEEPNIF